MLRRLKIKGCISNFCCENRIFPLFLNPSFFPFIRYTVRNSRIGYWTGSKRQKSILTKGDCIDLILPPFVRIDFWQLSIPPRGEISNHVGYIPKKAELHKRRKFHSFFDHLDNFLAFFFLFRKTSMQTWNLVELDLIKNFRAQGTYISAFLH